MPFRDSEYRKQVLDYADIVSSLCIGLLSTLLCYIARTRVSPGPGDFRYALRFARDLLNGSDPYAYPVSALSVPYPLPAALFGFPVFWLSDAIAASIFFGFSSAVLALGLLRDGPTWRLLLFTSPLYIHSLLFAQWSPLITAMAFFSDLLILVSVKPHAAMALALSGYVKWTRRAVYLVLVVGIVSLILMPSWPFRWLSQIGPFEGKIPLLLWKAGGPLLLLSLLRWQENDARLLFFMSLAPQRMFYDQLPLFIIPKTCKQMIFMLELSWLGALVFLFTGAWAWAQTVFIYLPMLGLVLRPHFNHWHEQSRTSSDDCVVEE